jgi:WS/DGAT/MGAT family acyltransferase
MDTAGYERLSKLDETFLSFETPTTYMHVALTAIFEPGSLVTRTGSVDVTRIRRHIAARLHLVPRYRQRLGVVPVVNDAIWVDDDRFDLRYHVRHASLPRPGTDAQLRARCAEILEQPLDRSRPLWEMWVIEGLAQRRFALLTKVHHCVVDGVAGMGILAALFGFDPSEASGRPQPWRARRAPEPGRLLRDEMARRTGRILDLGRALRDGAGGVAGVRTAAARVSSLLSLMSSGLRRPAACSFNGAVGPHRRIAWTSFALDEVKAAGRSVGATLNDTVLATVGGALQRYFERKGEVPATIKVAVPVNVRSQADGAEAGNRVSILVVDLPLVARDARARLERIRDITAALRAADQRQGAVVLTQAAEWTSGHIVHAATRLLSRASPYNLIVTNVPGPPLPLYLLDAPMMAAYPHLPLFEHQGLGIALVSYAGRLYIGLTGEWDLAADIDVLVGDLGAAFDAMAGRQETHVARAAPSKRVVALPHVALTTPREVPVDPSTTDGTTVRTHL